MAAVGFSVASGCQTNQQGLRIGQAADARVSFVCSPSVTGTTLNLDCTITNKSKERVYVGACSQPSVVEDPKRKEMRLELAYRPLPVGCYDLGTGLAKRSQYELRPLLPGESLHTKATVEVPLQGKTVFSDGYASRDTPEDADTRTWKVCLGYFTMGQLGRQIHMEAIEPGGGWVKTTIFAETSVFTTSPPMLGLRVVNGWDIIDDPDFRHVIEVVIRESR
jgi:hypothetical protein